MRLNKNSSFSLSLSYVVIVIIDRFSLFLSLSLVFPFSLALLYACVCVCVHNRRSRAGIEKALFSILVTRRHDGPSGLLFFEEKEEKEEAEKTYMSIYFSLSLSLSLSIILDEKISCSKLHPTTLTVLSKPPLPLCPRSALPRQSHPSSS